MSGQESDNMLEDTEGLPVEAISFSQFMRAIAGKEVEGVPTGEIAYPVKKVEPIAGTEMYKKRVRVSFDFDVTCNDKPVYKLTGDEGAMVAALLKSFLVADKAKL